MNAWHKTSAADLGRAFRAGRVSPVEVLNDVLQQCERVNPVLNSIVALDETGAKEAATASERRFREGTAIGPLDGVPLTIKDNLLCRGLPASWGSPLFRHFVPAEDELPVARIRAAGAVIVGKTNVPQFTLQGYTSNPLFGLTHNPWATELTPGGSSGGAVAAVASGIGTLAIATDGGGSVRRPTGYTHLVGLKPSIGRIARGAGFPQILYDLEVIGLIARTVEDVSLLYRVLSGPDARDRRSLAAAFIHNDSKQLRRQRIRLLLRLNGSPLDAEIADAVALCASRFAELGHYVDESDMHFSVESINEVLDVIFAAGMARIVRGRESMLELDAPLAQLLDRGVKLSAADFLTALDALSELRARTDTIFGDYDVLMTPTAAAMPWSAAESYPRYIDGSEVGPRSHAIYTGFVNVLGIAAIAIPAPRSPTTGLPIGVQLVTRFGHEETLLAMAGEYEATWPWSMEWPPGMS